MPQWTAFDEQTSSALRSKLPQETVFERHSDSAMDYLLDHRQCVVAVLPCRGFGQAALAVMRWNAIPAVLPPPNPAPTVSRRTRTSGFLGLSDEPVFEEDEAQEKKSWWKRFWEP